MAATSGRKLRVKYDADGAGAGTAVVIAGARTDSLTIANEAIDVTDKDDVGVRTLLDDIGTKGMEMSCEGVLTDDTLAALARGATTSASLHWFEFDIDGIGNYRGEWFISNFEMSGAEGTDPATFSATFQSSGAITFT